LKGENLAKHDTVAKLANTIHSDKTERTERLWGLYKR